MDEDEKKNFILLFLFVPELPVNFLCVLCAVYGLIVL